MRLLQRRRVGSSHPLSLLPLSGGCAQRPQQRRGNRLGVSGSGDILEVSGQDDAASSTCFMDMVDTCTRTYQTATGRVSQCRYRRARDAWVVSGT